MLLPKFIGYRFPHCYSSALALAVTTPMVQTDVVVRTVRAFQPAEKRVEAGSQGTREIIGHGEVPFPRF